MKKNMSKAVSARKTNSIKAAARKGERKATRKAAKEVAEVKPAEEVTAEEEKKNETACAITAAQVVAAEEADKAVQVSADAVEVTEQANAEAPATEAEETPAADTNPAPNARPAVAPGVTVTKVYKGVCYEVSILADGKRCTVNGTEYSSLSTAVRKVIGQQVSGQKFWGFAQGTRPAKVEEAPVTEEAEAPAEAPQQTEAAETVEG